MDEHIILSALNLALTYLVFVSSQLIALMERVYGKENGAGPKN